MKRTMILVGDINLLGVADPELPFARVAPRMRAADVVFANLECCFCDPAGPRDLDREGFYAPTAAAAALRAANVHAVGIANNVNYGGRAIASSLAVLDRLGIAHSGAGANRTAAAAPAVVERAGLRFGFLQRTSVFWPTDHAAGEHSPGVAVVRGHTAYRPRLEVSKAATRPGAPPEILTWADPEHLAGLRDDIARLRRECDILVASHHWGYDAEVLAYQAEIAHAAVDAGADVVMGHGPHLPLAIEVYKGRPVFYGLGSFSFDIGHRGRKHGDWIGLMARLAFDDTRLVEAAVAPVRHNAGNETLLRRAAEEGAEMALLAERSARFSTRLEAGDDEVAILGLGAG
ncbi:MAG: CapA family protein [Proteobacteria bacterium]|nr:CapA family protein [Pseudomonadota bacterium]